MRRRSTLMVLLALLPAAACGRGHAPAENAPAAVVGEAPPAAVESTAPVPDPEPTSEPVAAADPPEDPQQQELVDAWQGDPRGSVAQISLRFVAALQRGDDLAAVHELDGEERLWLSMRDLRTLHLVMSDVRKNAALAGAGPCRRVRQLTQAAAVVTCGRRHVVVNARPWAGLPGVRLSDWTLHSDVYHGPHTHAYTLMEL